MKERERDGEMIQSEEKGTKILRHGSFRRKIYTFAEKLGVHQKFQNLNKQLPSPLLASNLKKKTCAITCLQT